MEVGIKQKLSKHKDVLEERFNVENLGVFGSYARDEQKKDSDVDLLVEFSKPVSFFTFIELEEFLEEQLGTEVDLVTKSGLKNFRQENVDCEIKYR
ncbi:MAG: nucleotidyltransferase family protein [Candidatus Paceibacteria bacterium]